MRLASQLLAALLVFLMTPGLTELVDDAAHLLRTGHTEHSQAHTDHGGGGSEHGCTGTFHVCSCHQSPAFLSPPEPPALPQSAAQQHTPAWRHDGAAEGVRFGLLRPPIG